MILYVLEKVSHLLHPCKRLSKKTQVVIRLWLRSFSVMVSSFDIWL